MFILWAFTVFLSLLQASSRIHLKTKGLILLTYPLELNTQYFRNNHSFFTLLYIRLDRPNLSFSSDSLVILKRIILWTYKFPIDVFYHPKENSSWYANEKYYCPSRYVINDNPDVERMESFINEIKKGTKGIELVPEFTTKNEPVCLNVNHGVYNFNSDVFEVLPKNNNGIYNSSSISIYTKLSLKKVSTDPTEYEIDIVDINQNEYKTDYKLQTIILPTNKDEKEDEDNGMVKFADEFWDENYDELFANKKYKIVYIPDNTKTHLYPTEILIIIGLITAAIGVIYIFVNNKLHNYK